MITYIELWKSKQAWKDLPKEGRANYLAALGPAIQQLIESGVKIITWGTNDSATFNKADYDYFAVWNFPDTAAAQAFEKLVESAGWYDYFTQVNLMGASVDPQQVMQQMIES